MSLSHAHPFTRGRAVTVPIDGVKLAGDLTVPAGPRGIVVFAHGSGSSRFSQRNRSVAARLHEARLATLLFDLLTETEERVDAVTSHLRFDIPFLATRLVTVTEWVRRDEEVCHLPVGYFGASTGAAAALVAAAELPGVVSAVVSRGGRPDLARHALAEVFAPTLLIVGGNDLQVLRLNQTAFDQLPGIKKLEIVPRAGHLFEEPGTLDVVATLAARWFERYLVASVGDRAERASDAW
jgi:pimeloyl-ACP methyl ester carboxylesterase